MKREWRLFKHDDPGERFSNHRHRMDAKPTWHKVVHMAAGIALVGLGLVFWVLPGPGTIAVVFGLALLAGMSKTIAQWLDRIEQMLRRGLHRARRFWRGLTTGKRRFVLAVASVAVVLGAVVVWRGWLGPKVAGYLG